MKIKEGYVLRQVADLWVVLPLAEETVNFNGMIKLNDCGALLWKELERGCEPEVLVDAVLAEYRVSREQARADVTEFLENLSKVGCLEP